MYEALLESVPMLKTLEVSVTFNLYVLTIFCNKHMPDFPDGDNP